MFLFLVLIVRKPDENIECNYINVTATVKVNAIAILLFQLSLVIRCLTMMW